MRRMATSALIIENPAARRALGEGKLRPVLDIATQAGWHIELTTTNHAGHATELARDAAARGVHVVIVHGGDGTLNEAVNGVTGSATAVAPLRGGTANVWAKEARFPKNPVDAMQAIVHGERRRIDLGRAGDRYFLLMAGVGLDALIVPRIGARMKKRAGAAAYIIAGVAAALRTKPWQADLSFDGEPAQTSLYWLLAGNTRSYGGLANLTHRALIDDGALDIALMRRGGAHRLLANGAQMLLKRHDRSANILYRRTRILDINTPGIPVQLDGEPHGETPIYIECIPAALDVIVPRGVVLPLFRSEAREL